MSKATKVSIQSTDPGYPSDASSVTKEVTKSSPNDKVVVNAWETGVNTNSRKAVVALKISTGPNPTASFDSKGVVTLTASNTGTTAFLLVELDTADPNNWTVNLNTSGGTSAMFRKGSGGGGRKR
ncbi:MAG: hypothetical protein IPK70_13985 [Flavobacteriales bacterium]|jgi:hypothetical protein|nr:hypothetical protein [Flavobacteriales bacterium]